MTVQLSSSQPWGQIFLSTLYPKVSEGGKGGENKENSQIIPASKQSCMNKSPTAMMSLCRSGSFFLPLPGEVWVCMWKISHPLPATLCREAKPHAELSPEGRSTCTITLGSTQRCSHRFTCRFLPSQTLKLVHTHECAL